MAGSYVGTFKASHSLLRTSAKLITRVAKGCKSEVVMDVWKVLIVSKGIIMALYFYFIFKGHIGSQCVY